MGHPIFDCTQVNASEPNTGRRTFLQNAPILFPRVLEVHDNKKVTGTVLDAVHSPNYTIIPGGARGKVFLQKA